MKRTNILGRYKPKNSTKYIGRGKITYRSMWERRFMLWCDRSKKVAKWDSEGTPISYYSRKDNRWRTYYPDFYVETYNGRHLIVEIKPKYQRTWGINIDKWKAARKYCSERGMEFYVLDETQIF